MSFMDWLSGITGGGQAADQRFVTDPHGESIRVGKIGGKWHYFYDGEWIPASDYGRRGATVRGDRLVAR